MGQALGHFPGLPTSTSSSFCRVVVSASIALTGKPSTQIYNLRPADLSEPKPISPKPSTLFLAAAVGSGLIPVEGKVPKNVDSSGKGAMAAPVRQETRPNRTTVNYNEEGARAAHVCLYARASTVRERAASP